MQETEYLPKSCLNRRAYFLSGSIPGSGRSPGGGHSNQFQCCCLENPMDRGAWLATVHRVAKSWIQPKWLSTHEFSLHTLPRPDEDIKESGLPYSTAHSSVNQHPLLSWSQHGCHSSKCYLLSNCTQGGKQGAGYFLSFVRRKFFPEGSGYFPLLPIGPKWITWSLCTNHGAEEWNHPQRLPQSEPSLIPGSSCSSLLLWLPTPEQSGQKGDCLSAKQSGVSAQTPFPS